MPETKRPAKPDDGAHRTLRPRSQVTGDRQLAHLIAPRRRAQAVARHLRGIAGTQDGRRKAKQRRRKRRRAARLLANYPEILETRTNLGAVAAASGRLSPRKRRMVMLARAIGANSEGPIQAHARQAPIDGVTLEDLGQVCPMAITTLGFPAAIAALRWVNDDRD